MTDQRPATPPRPRGGDVSAAFITVVLFVIVGTVLDAWSSVAQGYADDDWGGLLGPLIVTAVVTVLLMGVIRLILSAFLGLGGPSERRQ